MASINVQIISVKINTQEIQPYEADGVMYHADTCLPLIDAFKRKKLKFKALARHTYPNHLTITRPWEAHKVGNPHIGMGKFYWVIIDLGVRRPHQDWVWPDWITLTPSDLTRITTILRQNEKSVWKTDQRVRDCFLRINKAVNTDIKGSNASKIRLLINYLLILLLDLMNTNDIILNESLTDSSRSVNYFLNELEKNISENWTIEQMAESAGVGVTRFTYHCKRLTNLTPMRYLTMKRLELSKKMLQKNDLNITEVAYTCGFATSQYFATVFKKHENCSPNEYRTKQQIENFKFA